MVYPESLVEAIDALKKLPGVGEKSAERYALSLMEMSNDNFDLFIQALKDCKQKLKYCESCGHITDNNICYICSDEDRNRKLICVVEDYKSIIMFEKSRSYNGLYHVLNGLISPIDGVMPEDLNINSLFEKIDKLGDNVEIIMALKPSVEGETTSLYIKKMLENKNVKVSRLSYGIPMGVDIDYLDSLTLDKALLDRKDIA